MAIPSRRYSEPTLKKLFSLAHNQCSFPNCPQKIARENRTDFTVNICHIEDAKKGGRYNPNMSDPERCRYENLILLCTIHHTETNDVTKYSVEDLKAMKINHHIKMNEKYSSEGLVNKRNSFLIEVINKISASDLFDESNPKDVSDSFDILDKINYNSVIRYRPIIEEYKVYQGKLTKIYSEIEAQGSTKKEVLLRNIKQLYLTAKGKLLSGNYEIRNIQERADDLIEEVEAKLWDLIENKNSDLNETVSYEEINPNLSVILVDAFMRCKILEEPPKNAK